MATVTLPDAEVKETKTSNKQTSTSMCISSAVARLMATAR